MVINLGSNHLETVLGSAIQQATHTADEVEGVRVEATISEIRIIDVNGDDLANHEAAAGRGS